MYYILVEFIRTRTQGFRTRSPTRDKATDRTYVSQVNTAIGGVLGKLESERAGLKQRMADVMSRAAITAGNGDDEHLTRDAIESDLLDGFESEMKRGQRRLVLLDSNISRFRVVQETLEAEFPEYFRTVR